MLLTSDGKYKVVETSGALIICAWDVKVANDPTAQPLLRGTFTDVLQYIDKYYQARADGKDPKHAHDIALHRIGVSKMVIARDMPDAIKKVGS